VHETTEKQYGKLSEEQFRRLIGKLPEIRAGARELGEELRSATPEKVRAMLDEGIYWAAFYELPFVQHVALGLYVLGQGERVIEFAKSEDPQEAMLRFMDSAEDLEPIGPDGQELDLAAALSAVVSMQHTILSIMLYQRSMSALVAEAREGNDDSLFQAVRIDRSAMTCPSIAMRISKAQLLGEKRFFERLRSALKGPSKKHWEAYSDLRYSLAVLRELGFDAMSDAELEHLLVDVLKVYPKTWSARKNLRKQYTESKKIRTT
jgi:hypothetical protein